MFYILNMKAICFFEHGDIEKLKVQKVPEPEVKDNEVLIKISFSALNHLDLFVLSGWKGLNLKFPHICGADGTGKIVEIGKEVEGFKVGDEVVINPGISCMKCNYCLMGEHSLCKNFGILGENFDGTFAEYVSVPYYNVEIAPEHLSYEERAAFPLTFLTSYRMLFKKGKVKAGDSVLIHGGGSGVSISSLLLLKEAGCKVFLTTSKEDKIEKLKEIGASEVINYKKENVLKRVLDLTGGEGVDFVIDCAGKETWLTSLRVLKKGGKILTCGATTGPDPQEEIRLIFWKQIEIIGSTMSSISEFKEMVKFVKEKKIRPIIDSVFPLEEAKEAYKKLKEGRQFGKIIFSI